MARGGARKGAGRKPGKVSQAKRTIAEMAKEHGELALQTLVDVATDGEAPHAAKVSAANALLDRGYGKPVQAITGPGPEGEHIVTQITRRIVDPKPDGKS